MVYAEEDLTVQAQNLVSQWKWAVQAFLETDIGLGALRGLDMPERTAYRQLLEISIPTPIEMDQDLAGEIRGYKEEKRAAIWQRYCFNSLVKNSSQSVDDLRSHFTTLTAQSRGGRIDIELFIKKRMAELADRGVLGTNTIPVPIDEHLLTSTSERPTLPQVYDPKFLAELRDLDKSPESAVLQLAKSGSSATSQDILRPPPSNPSQPGMPVVRHSSSSGKK